jgi:hypothetical protein
MPPGPPPPLSPGSRLRCSFMALLVMARFAVLITCALITETRGTLHDTPDDDHARLLIVLRRSRRKNNARNIRFAALVNHLHPNNRNGRSRGTLYDTPDDDHVRLYRIETEK